MDKEVLEAIELAITNKAHITGITGVSFPNGKASAGTCRDVKLDLDEAQSKRVLEGIKSIISLSPKPGED